MKHITILFFIATTFFCSCKESASSPPVNDSVVVQIKPGTVFHYQASSTEDGIPRSIDSMMIRDSIIRDTVVHGKHAIACFDGFGRDGFHYIAYENDGNISVLIDEGDKVWVKLPVSTTIVTTVLDTTLITSDHWIFTAKRNGTETRTINGQSVTSTKILLTWRAGDKDNPMTDVEIFTYFFAPQIGYFTATSLEYLPVVNGGTDAIEKRELMDWK